MLDRIKTSIFNPKYIGKFLSDKISTIIAYFCFLVFFASLPAIIQIVDFDEITVSSQTTLMSSFRHSDTSSLYFENNELIGNEKVYYRGNGIIISFNTTDISDINDNVVFCFEKENASVYYYGLKVSTLRYASMSFEDFSIAEVQNHRINGLDNLFSMINSLYKDLQKYYIPANILSTLVRNAVVYAIAVVIVLMATLKVNPKINVMIFRTKICAYAVTNLALMSVLGDLFGIGILFYIGIFMTGLAASKAFKSIVKIEVRK